MPLSGSGSRVCSVAFETQSMEALCCESKMQSPLETFMFVSKPTFPTSPVTHPQHQCSSPTLGQTGLGEAGHRRVGGHCSAVDPAQCVISGRLHPLCPSPPLKGVDHSTYPICSPGEEAKIKHASLENIGPGVPRSQRCWHQAGTDPGPVPHTGHNSRSFTNSPPPLPNPSSDHWRFTAQRKEKSQTDAPSAPPKQ